MKKLRHNGVLVPPPYAGRGFSVKVKGKRFQLTPRQEEMALAWAMKVGTPYVEDAVFARNFHHDFGKVLGVKLKAGDVDFSELITFVEEERLRKASLSKEEKKALAASRKAIREENKERYGTVLVDGEKVEVGNYAVEPNCIFMGRGKHPMRGSWKEGPSEEDVELNLSKDAKAPPGRWKQVVWQPEAMWIARWKDKLSGKMKYVWFSDASPLKQKKDFSKFEMAKVLRQNLQKVQQHVYENLAAKDEKTRKIATVCFLIDRLKIRVGDEKDPDEADTVGASTLRPEHLRFEDDSTVTFNFLGKDSVPHVFKVSLPEQVIANLTEFVANANPTLFHGVRSQHVSEFLDKVMTGLSSKVFRTVYASDVTERKLAESQVKQGDPEYSKKFAAKMANLEAARICNHKRTIPKTWRQSLDNKKERLKTLKQKASEVDVKYQQKTEEVKKKQRERLKTLKKRLKAAETRLETLKKQLAERRAQNKPVQQLEKRVKSQRQKTLQSKRRVEELKAKHRKRLAKLRQNHRSKKQRSKMAVEKQKTQIRLQEETRDFNLNTSLKSYIDPRIYHKWGTQVSYDWTKYYPKSLQLKFSWVENPKLLKKLR